MSCPSGSRIIADCSVTVDSTTVPPKWSTIISTAARSDTDSDRCQADLVHDAVGPSVDLAFRVVEKFEHQTVANQVRGAQPDRLLQLQKLSVPLWDNHLVFRL
jgi:hypothetical protein